MIELSPEQLRALEGQAESPPRFVDPRTGQTFVLVKQEVYELARRVLQGHERGGWDDPSLDDYERYRGTT